jgi:hypothetical protein
LSKHKLNGWSLSIPSLEEQIDRAADVAFSGSFERSANSMVYWIGVVGPHWRYGVKNDGQELNPLIDWHDTTHDQDSYNDFQGLTALIEDMLRYDSFLQW